MPHDLTCRVCGRPFQAVRFDAKTCTVTCRMRLHRGEEFAYGAGWPMADVIDDIRRWIIHDQAVAADKEARAAGRSAREAKREVRQAQEKVDRLREETERLREKMANPAPAKSWTDIQNEVLADAQRRQMAQERDRQHRLLRSSVAMALKYFTKERRNDMSAAAIAALLDRPEYPADLVEEMLEERRQGTTSGSLPASESSVDPRAR